jgi:hypothetical protein
MVKTNHHNHNHNYNYNHDRIFEIKSS